MDACLWPLLEKRSDESFSQKSLEQNNLHDTEQMNSTLAMTIGVYLIFR